jgi:hypothetical protein
MTITDEMVERAAKASWDQMESELESLTPIPWDEMHIDVRERVKKRMRVALEAALQGYRLQALYQECDPFDDEIGKEE